MSTVSSYRGRIGRAVAVDGHPRPSTSEKIRWRSDHRAGFHGQSIVEPRTRGSDAHVGGAVRPALGRSGGRE
eukprot:1421345-Pyramimonas_sp.AAC.1